MTMARAESVYHSGFYIAFSDYRNDSGLFEELTKRSFNSSFEERNIVASISTDGCQSRAIGDQH